METRACVFVGVKQLMFCSTKVVPLLVVIALAVEDAEYTGQSFTPNTPADTVIGAQDTAFPIAQLTPEDEITTAPTVPPWMLTVLDPDSATMPVSDGP